MARRTGRSRRKLPDEVQKARDEALARRRQALQEHAAKIAPPIAPKEFDDLVSDEGAGNIGTYGNLLSLCPWYPVCAMALNVNPYRGCTNQCSYCYVNQYARGYIARAPGLTSRKFYGAVKNLDPLQRMLDVWAGRRKIAQLPQGEQLYGEYFARGVPLRLAASTDPFCALEKRFRHSANILRMVGAVEYPLVITTKGGALFDSYFDAIVSLPKKIVQFLLISVDDEVRADFEPNSPPIPMRLSAMERLAKAGVYVSVRMAPVIPDSRILAPEHLERFADILQRIGVTIVDLSPLRIKKGVQQGTSNEALLKIMPQLNTTLFAGNRLSLPLETLLDFGRTIGPLLTARGISYGQSKLCRYSEFHKDYDSACHCAQLDQLPGFENYYQATLSQALLDAKCLWDKHRLPVLMDCAALEKYWYPADYIVPSRSKAQQIPFRDMLRIEWEDALTWFWPEGVVFYSYSTSEGMPWVDFDPISRTLSYIYQPVMGNLQVLNPKQLEKLRAEIMPERAVVLLDGTKLPLPIDRPDHPFWAERRAKYKELVSATDTPKGGELDESP